LEVLDKTNGQSTAEDPQSKNRIGFINLGAENSKSTQWCKKVTDFGRYKARDRTTKKNMN